MSSDAAARLWDDIISHRLFQLVRSTNAVEKMGGIVAIGASGSLIFLLSRSFLHTEHLLDVEQEETLQLKQNLYRLYNHLKTLLPDPDMGIMKAAAKTLGHIIELLGSAFDERFMDFEVPAAIELMQSERQENGRYAGVLLLKELAKNNSTLFHQHIALVFEKLLIPLRDTRAIIREAAAELLAACLDIVTQRERQARMDFLFKILQDAQAGLKMNSAEIIHGALLTYRELLLHGDMVRLSTYLLSAALAHFIPITVYAGYIRRYGRHYT